MIIDKQYFLNRFIQASLLAISLCNFIVKMANSETIVHQENIKYDKEVSIIPLRDDCSTTEPIEKYSVRDGEVEGVLYATACENGGRPSPLTDYIKYIFIDTGGTTNERCYGIINTFTSSGIEYSWEFKGAVPGYSCSKSRQTIQRLYPKGY